MIDLSIKEAIIALAITEKGKISCFSSFIEDETISVLK